MKTWVYSWIIYPFAYFAAMLFGLVNTKVRDTLRLRSWKDFLSLRFNVGHPIEYWVHVASHGELEYAIPILQELSLRKKRVLITYYSISAKGPVEQLQYSLSNVSLVVPLPHDGLGLMRDFVALVRQQGVRHLLLMKYELWPGLLWECNAQGVKVLLVDALKPGWFHRRLLHKLDAILSGYHSEVAAIAHKNVQVVGDTRVERVIKRIEESVQKLEIIMAPNIKFALEQKPVLICGSMWPLDTNLVVAAIELFRQKSQLFNLVWVPHELDSEEEKRAKSMLRRLGYDVYTVDAQNEAFPAMLPDKPLALIVMKKGILAELYQLGQAAFVGGGFGKCVHSVWEPALSGARVACGPHTKGSPESTELASRNMLVRVDDPSALARWFERNLRERKMGREAFDQFSMQDLVKSHIGAAKRIVGLCELGD